MGGYVPPHMREGGRGHEGAVGGDRAGGRGGRRGRQASSSRADRNRQPSAPATPDAAVEDAVRRKDAAERKLGKDGARGVSAAATTLASIAQELRSALTVPHLSPSARSDAGLALGEALCAAAAATVTAARHGPLTPDLARAERDARAAAARMYEDAAAVLADLASWCERQIPESGDDPDAWADATLAATTAAANALAARGDVGAVSREDNDQNRVVDALARAVDAYESATHLASRAEANACDVRSKNAAAADALAGLWNLADARVKLAEAIAASGQGFCHGFGHDQNHDQNQNQNVARAETLFAAAFAAYELACARCDSRAGDDLAGLLMDWGVGHASHARVLADAGGVCDADVAARALEACERAFEKLARAAEFGVGDVDAHVALGEAHRARSDVLRAMAGIEARRRMETSCPESLDRSTRSPDDLFADADAALARVSDPDHPHPLGFAMALRLDSRHLDALVGAAECHVERGKMRVSFQPSENPSRNGDDSKAHFARGWATYRVALEGPLLFPDDRVDPGWASDRLEMAYNAACAACLAGDLDAGERLLESVVECDDTTREAIAADADLEALRSRRTFAGVPPGG